MLLGSDVDDWFDRHSSTMENWPFQFKYVCGFCLVGYRHFHRTHEERQISIRKTKRMLTASAAGDDDDDDDDDSSTDQD